MELVTQEGSVYEPRVLRKIPQDGRPRLHLLRSDDAGLRPASMHRVSRPRNRGPHWAKWEVN